MLLAIMDDVSWKKYEPHKSDVLKNEFQTEIFEDNLMDYISLWVKLGIKHPSQYLNAFFNLTYGYWYPNDILPDTTTYRKYIEVYTGADITFDSKLPWLFKSWRLSAWNLLTSFCPESPCFSAPVFMSGSCCF